MTIFISKAFFIDRSSRMIISYLTLSMITVYNGPKEKERRVQEEKNNKFAQQLYKCGGNILMRTHFKFIPNRKMLKLNTHISANKLAKKKKLKTLPIRNGERCAALYHV